MSVQILIGDCRVRMAELPDNSVDSVVCDPPYHLIAGGFNLRTMTKNGDGSDRTRQANYRKGGFMGQTWDGGDVAFQPDTWAEVLRVLKPGGHLIAFSGTRTYHRMVCAIEDAGFEIRDQLAWVYGSGFPKSLDVSKQIDKAAGAEREVVGVKTEPSGRNRLKEARGVVDRNTWGDNGSGFRESEEKRLLTAPATDAAREWQGWGTALKPSWETIALAQKPYDFRQLCGILAHKITEALCQLPSLAKDAEPSSWLSQSVFAGEFGSAQWSAVAECNTPGALFDLMATLPSVSGLPSSLNTALSWLGTLGAVLELANTFTTETASSLTTDLKTLNSLLSRNTPTIIASAAIPQHGEPSAALLAASLFSAVSARLSITHTASALDPATLRGDDWDIRPKLQPICLARKPPIGTVAANVLEHGTGALNIDGCRIAGESTMRTTYSRMTSAGKSGGAYGSGGYPMGEKRENGSDTGRWPANLCHDGSEEVLAGFPETTSGNIAPNHQKGNDARSSFGMKFTTENWNGDSGSAARFFYCAKATTEERGEGNTHPTVKPVALMRWLVRLVTPKGGTVLDPFMGSGSTLLAAEAEQFSAIGCEMSEEYAGIAERRIREAAGMFADVTVRRLPDEPTEAAA